MSIYGPEGEALGVEVPPGLSALADQVISNKPGPFAAPQGSATGPKRRFTAVQRDVCNRGQTGRSAVDAGTAAFDPKRPSSPYGGGRQWAWAARSSNDPGLGERYRKSTETWESQHFRTTRKPDKSLVRGGDEQRGG
jgi:hypothetical protein